VFRADRLNTYLSTVEEPSNEDSTYNELLIPNNFGTTATSGFPTVTLAGAPTSQVPTGHTSPAADAKQTLFAAPSFLEPEQDEEVIKETVTLKEVMCFIVLCVHRCVREPGLDSTRYRKNLSPKNGFRGCP